jgi:hypothetical protein
MPRAAMPRIAKFSGAAAPRRKGGEVVEAGGVPWKIHVPARLGLRELHRRRVVFPRERIDARLLHEGHVRPRLAVLPEGAEEAENRERSSRSKPGGRIRYLPPPFWGPARSQQNESQTASINYFITIPPSPRTVRSS